MSSSIRIQLLTLAKGERVLRLEDPDTGLSVERKLKPEQAVLTQKARLVSLFEAMLRSELTAN
jgi:hypothetical protein